MYVIKAIKLPYQNGHCRECMHCTKQVTCAMYKAGELALPCPAIRVCHKKQRKRTE